MDNPNIPNDDVVGIKSLKPKRRNPNAGTLRGSHLLESSFNQVGAGRSILIDGDGNVLCGDHVLQAAVDTGITEVLVVEGRPDRLVAVKRADLSIESERGRLMIYYDQRAAEKGTAWDGGVILTDLLNGVDLGQMFFPTEVEEILSAELDQMATHLAASLSSAPLEEALQNTQQDRFSQPSDPNPSVFNRNVLTCTLSFVDIAKRGIAVAIATREESL